MKKQLVTCVFAVIAISVFSQGNKKDNLVFQYPNSIQVELFGHGLFYSLNYERIILNHSKFKTTGQIGAAYYPPRAGVIDFWMPLSVNELITFGNHHVEGGIGHVFTYETYSTGPPEFGKRKEWNGFVIGRLGYRYQEPDSKILIRIGFTPFMEYMDYTDFHPSGGLSIGYTF